MDDKTIVELYWQRDESAIEQTRDKYGRYCRSIAYNILLSDEDAEECENDTYLRTWQSIPENRPALLKSFVGKISRNLALDRYDASHAQKRYSNTDAVLSEMWDCVPDTSGSISDEYILREAINSFLSGLPMRTRIIFMRRYFYMCSVSEIAERLSMSESNVKVTLLRTRNKFKAYLEKEGISI